MLPPLRSILLSLTLLALLPSAALAHPVAQPLVDAKPFAGVFKDRVTSSNPREARLAAGSDWGRYMAPDGTQVDVSISPQYGDSIDPSVPQSYVDFLDSLDHGPELAKLKVYIAPPDEVLDKCGGVPGTLACYDSTTQIMTVPGEQVQTDSGVTTSYVVAHEYGHHIATFRSNAPFRSFTFGPKYWSSYELVCDRSLAGLLFPGNEQEHYFQNPGESWAETYAQLKYPGVNWQYTTLLQPTDDAFTVAKKDVVEPWTGREMTTFNGTFGAHGGPKTFRLPLTLDGTITVRMHGPRHSDFSFISSSGGRHSKWSTSRGSNDRQSYQAVCRSAPTQTLKIVVRRITGQGPFTLMVSYPG